MDNFLNKQLRIFFMPIDSSHYSVVLGKDLYK